MNPKHSRRLWLGAMLLASLAFCGANPARAQDNDDRNRDRDRDYRNQARDTDRDYQRSRDHRMDRQGTYRRFEWHRQPRWVSVPGTHVMVVRGRYRPDFDAFRSGTYYYVYQDGDWYRSRDWRGRYVLVPESDLPGDFRRVPRHHWQHYPDQWGSNSYNRDRDRDWQGRR